MGYFLAWFEEQPKMDAVLKAALSHHWFVTIHPFDDGNVTPWMAWFLGCLGRAIDGAQDIFGAVLAKARFWERIRDVKLNERQRLVINRLLDGFEGKLRSSKYAALAKCSQDTAHRDIIELVALGVLVQNPEGERSTSYSLRLGTTR